MKDDEGNASTRHYFVQIFNRLYVLYWHLILVAFLKRQLRPQLNMVLYFKAFLQTPREKVHQS